MAAFSRNQLEDLAGQAADKYGIPRNIFFNLINHESGWQTDAVSHDPKTGAPTAYGLVQMIDTTAKGFGLTPQQLLNDPKAALDAGAHYLSDSIKQFGGDPAKGAAAYFLGGGNIQRAINQGGDDWLKVANQIAQGYGYGPNTVTQYITNIGAMNAPAVQSTAKAPTQNAPAQQQTGSKPVATTQQDAASQQQFGKNYADLSPVQKYAIDAQSGIAANGQQATLYSADDVIKAGGKLSSSGNTYEIKTGGRGSATIYFYPTTDANGKPTGQLQAPVIYANGSSQPVPYTGTMPAGLKPTQGGGPVPSGQGGTPPAQGQTQTPPAGGQTQPPAGGTQSNIVPNASRSRGGNVDAYPSTTPTFAGVGGGAGAVLDALSRTGGPLSFTPGGGPAPLSNPYSLDNPEEVGRLSGLIVGPGGLDANYLRSQQDTGRDYFGYPNLGMVFGPNGWQFPNQFTQTQNQPPAGGGGGGGGSAPGGDVAQSSVPSGGATLANGNQAGGGGIGAKAADALGGVHITPPSLSGAGGLLSDIFNAGKGAFNKAEDVLGIGGGNKGFTASADVEGQPQASAAVSPTGAPSQFTQTQGGGGPVASAEVDTRNPGSQATSLPAGVLGGQGGQAAASGFGAGRTGPLVGEFTDNSGAGVTGRGGTVAGIAVPGPQVNQPSDFGRSANALANADAGSVSAGPGTVATASGPNAFQSFNGTNLLRKDQGQFTNTDNLSQGDQANQQQTMNLFGAQGFANGGEVAAGTNNPVGIFDLLTGRPIAIAGEAGRENVKVTPMKKGGKVTAGTPNTTYPSSQWSTGGPMGSNEPFFAADGAEFNVGNIAPQAGVGFSGPKQTTGYESLGYYSRPNTGLSPYPVPMEGPNRPPSGGGLSGTSNILSSLLGGGSTAPKLPSYIRPYGGGRDPNTRATLPTYYMDTRTGKTYDSAHLVPEQLADGGEFTVGSEDPSQSVFNTGYPNAGMSMHPDNTGLLRAMSSLMPVNGSQTQSDVDKSIQGMMASLGMGPSQALGNSKLKAGLTEKLGLSPRAGAAMGVLTGAAA